MADGQAGKRVGEGVCSQRSAARVRRAAAREQARIATRDRARSARAAEVQAMADELEEQGRLGLTRTYIQHGSVTVYDHVCAVARTSLAMADGLARIGIRVDRHSLLRGALLHDYFLYDWHDKDPSHRLHGFRHPFFALARAEEDFDLTPRERNIIVRHMFPLVPIPPTCREAWIVCIADKVCALRETVLMRGERHGSEPAPDASAAGDQAASVPGSASAPASTSTGRATAPEASHA